MAGPPPEEIIDLVKFLDNDYLDLIADPMFRSLLGQGGDWNQDAFQPTRSYIATPTYNNMMTWIESAPNSLEGLIAKGFLMEGKAPSQVTADIMAILNTDNPDIVPLRDQILETLPRQQVQGMNLDEPDTSSIGSMVSDLFDQYTKEQASLTEAGDVFQDEMGRFYTETPSEAAERFTSLGLPLPTETYEFSDLGMTPAEHQAQTRAGREDLRSNAYREMDNVDMARRNLEGWGVGENAPNKGNMWGNPEVQGSQTMDEAAIARLLETGMQSTNASPSQRNMTSQRGNPAVTGAEPMDDAAMARLLETGMQSQRTGSLGSGGRPGTKAQRGQLELRDALTRSLAGAEKGLADAQNRQRQFRQQREDEKWSMFTPDYFLNAGRIFGAQQRGNTPLGDVLNSAAGNYGLPNYQATGNFDTQTREGKQAATAAFMRLLGGNAGIGYK